MPTEAMDCVQFILEVHHSECSISNECQSIISFFLINNIYALINHQYSEKSGGGGGSGGAVSFSACTLTAGSSAKIEAKGGTGGDARDRGKRLLCHVVLSCSVILIQS